MPLQWSCGLQRRVRSLVPMECRVSYTCATSEEKDESTYLRVPLGEASQASGALGLYTAKLVPPTVMPWP
jgi:hypothetical protein